ncbi:lipopolysaccharide assembly LapA domain-containing protein [Paenibacillus sp. GCM10027626]|uniref:LapA family protein n=1 Tax=Paenibacillus sp. GCM10027626 TaxID=3273411 RepID=UPI00363A7E65
MRVQWTIIAALLFALLTGVFAVINMDSVKVNFLFSETQSPLILVILVSTVLGGLTVGLFGIVRQYKLQREIKHLESKLAELESKDGFDSIVGAVLSQDMAKEEEFPPAHPAKE